MRRIFQKRLKKEQDSPLPITDTVAKPLCFDKSLLSVTTSLGTVNLISLALPMFLENVFNVLLGTVNTAVLSGYSEEAVAATGAVMPLINMFSLLFSVIAIGATVVVSNDIGAEKLERAAKTTYSSVALCTVAGFLCGIVLAAFAAPIVRCMNLEGTVYQEALLYFRVRMTALVVSAASSVMFALLRCYGYPRATIVAGLASNVCNLLLSIYVVYYATHPWFMGVRGIALAVVVGQVLSLVIAVVTFIRRAIPMKRPSLYEAPHLIGSVLRIGLPTGLSSGSFTISQVITNAFVAVLGPTALSAKVYYTNILSYAYLFSVSVGNANSLLVGRLCGAGRYDHANVLNRAVVKVTIAVNFLVSLSLVLLRVPLLSLFTDNMWIIEVSLGVFLVDIITEQARAVSQIYEYALRAAGDVMFTLKILLVSCWVFSVGLAYVLSVPMEWGLIGCWIGLALDETVRAVSTVYRWRSGKWKYHLQ